MTELDWQVLENEPLPDAEEAQPRARRRLPWRRVLLAVLLIGLAGGLGFWRWVGYQETRLRDDLQRTVLQEERALRFGLAEQVRDLVDPSAPDGWTERYRRTFRAPAQEWSSPELLTIERRLDVAMVTLAFTSGEAEWRRVRAYRLVDDGWRRTPVPADWWGEPQAYTSEHFTLWMSDRDAEMLPPADLLAFLEGYRADLAAVVEGADDEPLTIRVQPYDLSGFTPDANRVQGDNTFVFNSPLLAEQEALPFLLPTRAYRYTLAQQVRSGITGRTAQPGQPAVLSAVVRYLLLTDEERRQYREWMLNQRNIDTSVTLDEGQPIAIPLLLPDYLAEAAGLDTLGEFSARWADTNSVTLAAEQVFGRPFAGLVEEAWLWVERGAGTRRPSARGEERTATLLAVTGEAPFRALVAVEEGRGVLDLQVDSDAALPLPAHCLGRGSVLRFRQTVGDDTGAQAETISLETLRLPALPYPPAPVGTRTLITRQDGAATRVVALDEHGTETPLFTLPKGAALVVHPRDASFAFLLQDECGTSANQFVARDNRYTRAPATLEGAGHLFWAEPLYLVDDTSQQAEEPRWTISAVLPGEVGEPTERAVTAEQAWGHLMGHGYVAEPRLMQFGDGTLQWFSLVRVLGGSGILLRDADLALPEGAEMQSVSLDGRWLAYTAPGEVEGSAVLYALNTETNRATLLHRAPEGTAYGEMVWEPAGVPTLLVALGAEEPGEAFSDALLGFNMGQADRTLLFSPQRYNLSGTVSGLHWCDNGRLFYRLTRGDETVLVEGVGGMGDPRVLVRLLPEDRGGVEMSPLRQSAELPPDGQVIGCMGG